MENFGKHLMVFYVDDDVRNVVETLKKPLNNLLKKQKGYMVINMIIPKWNI